MQEHTSSRKSRKTQKPFSFSNPTSRSGAPVIRKPVEKRYGDKASYGETKYERERRLRRERDQP